MTPCDETFSDEDLCRLQRELEELRQSPVGMAFPISDVKALLYRLKCAEANMGGHSERCDSVKCVCSKKDREKAWKEACGRG